MPCSACNIDPGVGWWCVIAPVLSRTLRPRAASSSSDRSPRRSCTTLLPPLIVTILLAELRQTVITNSAIPCANTGLWCELRAVGEACPY